MEIKSSSIQLLTYEYVRTLMRERKADSSKRDYGHALIIAGSFGMMGAAVLASRGCMRSGVGLLTAHVPSCGYQIMQISIPEVMCSVDSSSDCFSVPPPIEKFDAIAVGPGIGRAESTVRATEILLRSKPARLVIDADAINILASNRDLLELLPEQTIFTPHPGEFSRLMEVKIDDNNKIDMQRQFSEKYHAIVVLKGHETTISAPDGRLFKNTTGNPGMATAGSGDVLTGVILALRAQGYSASEAACIGVFLHGLAGDFAVMNTSEYSLISGDIAEYLSSAFKELI